MSAASRAAGGPGRAARRVAPDRARRRATPTTAAFGALLATLLSTATPPIDAAAQTVQGTVRDADYGRTVAGAKVLLIDSLAATLDSTTTDLDGRFRLDAPGPGSFILLVALEGFLSYSAAIDATTGDTARVDIEMPVVSGQAARVMSDVIDQEEAFQLPWQELCGEPVRPWEAGVLVGVSRDRNTLEPVPRAVIRLQPLASTDPGWPRTRIATATGSFWFCNVPPGRARIVARADGARADTSYASIRAGTVSWYDALLR